MNPLPPIPDRPFARRELARLGLTIAQVRRLRDHGVVRRVLRGVYAPASLPDTPEVRAAAALLVVADAQVLRDRTAAWVHGVDVFGYDEHEAGALVETCAVRGRDASEAAGVDGRTRDLSPEDIMEVGGARVTTPLRTALDLGCHLRRREAYAAMNELARRFGLCQLDFMRELSRFRGRRGVRQLRLLIARLEPRVESQRESWTLLEILDAGLPAPEPQHWVAIDGVATYRLDFAYVRRQVCVEYDGFEAHDSEPEQKEYDDARRAWLRANGWTVVVVRKGDFAQGASARWLKEIRTALVPSYSNLRWSPRRARRRVPELPTG